MTNAMVYLLVKLYHFLLFGLVPVNMSQNNLYALKYCGPIMCHSKNN